MKKRVIIATVFSVLSLVGCADMNSDFSCPMTNGMQCKRIDTVNDMVDQGAIDTTGQDQSHGSAGSPMQFTPDTNITADHIIQPYPNDMDAVSGQPLRYGESVMRLWVAPYEDAQDNYHAPSFIYTVVQSGHWTGIPMQELKGSE